jgi:hypothetical protein
MNNGCLMIVLGLLAFACAGGTETGNPPEPGVVSLGLTAYSSAPDIAALGTGGGGLSIDRAAMNVGQLTLLPCAAGTPALTIAAGEYDLTSNNVTELMGTRKLCALRIELVPATVAGRDLPAGVAIYLHGLRTDGSEFDVESTAPRTLELNATGGVPFGQVPLLLGFDFGSWFTGVDVHGAHAGADGVARLDAMLNPALLTALEAQTTAAVRLYADDDGNGVLGANERTPIASP